MTLLKQSWSNAAGYPWEYSGYCCELDRVTFTNATATEGCVSQYPTKGTNRCDHGVLLCNKFLLVGDYKKNDSDFDIAVKESVLNERTPIIQQTKATSHGVITNTQVCIDKTLCSHEVVLLDSMLPNFA